MRTSVFLFLAAFCLDPNVAKPDPWATFFRQKLDKLLKDASKRWPEEVNITNATETLVKRSDGWLSLRQGTLHNLSSWTIPEDITLNCTLITGRIVARVIAAVTFEALPFNFSYQYDNGTALGSPQEISGTLNGLTAELVYRVERFPVYYYSTVVIHLQKERTSVDLTSPILGNNLIRKSEMARAVKRTLDGDALTRLEGQLTKVLLSVGVDIYDIYAVPEACIPTTTPAAATSKNISVTTQTIHNYSTSPTKLTDATTGSHVTTRNPATADTNITFRTTETTTAETTERTTNPTTKQTNTESSLHTETSTGKLSDKTTVYPTSANKPTSALTTKYTGNQTLKPGKKNVTATKNSINRNTSYPNTAKVSKRNKGFGNGFHGREYINYNSRSEITTNQTIRFNKILRTMLSKASNMLMNRNLQPYKMVDTEDELYQKADGTVIMNVTLKGLRNVRISGDPDVRLTNETARVVADVEFSGVTYSAELRLISKPSTWIVEGDVGQLTGQLIVSVDYENASATNVSVESFELRPFVLLTGVPRPWVRKQVDAGELEDAVRGALMGLAMPLLCADDSAPLGNLSMAERWDLRSMLASIPSSATSPSTAFSTTTSNTTTSHPASTTPSSASSSRSPRVWVVQLAFVISALLVSQLHQ